LSQPRFGPFRADQDPPVQVDHCDIAEAGPECSHPKATVGAKARADEDEVKKQISPMLNRGKGQETRQKPLKQKDRREAGLSHQIGGKRAQ
jgi:hypothetical protein